MLAGKREKQKKQKQKNKKKKKQKQKTKNKNKQILLVETQKKLNSSTHLHLRLFEERLSDYLENKSIKVYKIQSFPLFPFLSNQSDIRKYKEKLK